MLVLLSDVHFTDGTSGETINPRAFEKFKNILLDIIGENEPPPKAKEVMGDDKPPWEPVKSIELVLLGDIFDVIRSEVWLCEDNQGDKPIRPWSAPDDVDQKGCTLEYYTDKIVNRIISNPQNIEALGYLNKLREECKEKNITEFKISYLVGNHDWLINRYPTARLAIARFLGLPNWDCYEEQSFPYYHEFLEYGVMARHGDYYDPLNYSGNRDASSLGDALVIDLLNRFPQKVKTDLQLGDKDPLYLQLKEIDNVRPLLEIPAWIKGICRHQSAGIEAKVHEAWNVLAQKFFKIPYVRAFMRSNLVLGMLLRVALKLTSGFSFGWLMRFLAGKTIRRWYQKTSDYKSFAVKEPALQDERVKYVVYGHTHTPDQVPLDVIPIKNQPHAGLDRLYFNSGTWRRVYEHTAYDWRKCEFIGWHVLTFLIFYLKTEKDPDRNYEEWSASLGYGR